MAKPNPGEYYTVVSGDRIRAIARRAYGYDNSSKIIDANSDRLNGRSTSLEGLPTIFRGDRLWLPPSATSETDTIVADFDDEIAIRLGGKVFKGWTASRISRNIDTIADGFSFELPYDPDNSELRNLTRPYSYTKADLFIGGELFIAGQCVKWAPGAQRDSTKKTIDVRTIAGHTIECMASKKALEYNNQSLADISTDMLSAYGLTPLFFDGDSDDFTKVTKEITETDFSFLTKLAQQKGFMITSSDDGGMAFLRAAVNGKPIARLVEGESYMENITAVYDGTRRFSSFMAVSESPGVSGNSYTLDDPSIPIYRPFAFSADDLEGGNLETAVQWKRSRSLADSTTLKAIITGWRNPDGQLWRENMVVSVLAPSVDIHTETNYIVKGIDLTKDEQAGDVITLSLILPQAYTLDFPDSFPWEG